MMGFFKRRREPEYEMITNEVPLSTMVRWFINDIGYADDGIDDFIGLPPISEEGLSKEKEDSNDRLNELKPLIPFIEFLSDTAANVLASIAVAETEDESIPEGEDIEEIAEMLGNLYKSVALSSIIGALSTAAALGLIDITAVTSDVKDIGGLYDE